MRNRHTWWHAPEWDAWRTCLEDDAFRVVAFVARRTWGADKPWERFYLSSIREGTSLSWDRVEAALKSLFEAGVLAASPWGPGQVLVRCELVEEWQPKAEVAA